MTRPDRDSIVSLLSQLVGIDSVNPSLVPGGAGEEEVARFVASWLESAGIASIVDEVAPGRFNAVGRLPGTGGGKSLMLNAHTDTVGLGAMAAPLDLRLEGDKAYGRGAYDMKGSLAAVMLAAKELAAGSPLAGDMVIAAVADEEYASLGTQALLKTDVTDGAIVTEPTSLNICVAHKGFAWIQIETEGRAAHGSRPDLGVDAIGMMGEVLTELNKLSLRLSERPAHSLLGHASLHASLIQGGQELSSYPARCLLQVERRTLPGESAEDVTVEIARVLGAVERREPTFRAAASTFYWRDAFEAGARSRLVEEMQESARTLLGVEPDVVGETPWMDSAFTQTAGVSTVVFGPGGSGAHSDEEWVSVRDIAACAEVLVDVARRYCQ